MTSQALPVGRRAAVSVPATTANLGPGFDTLGMALDWTDLFEVSVTPRDLTFDIRGEGTDLLPRNADHLVVRTLLDALDELGWDAPGLHLRAHSTIPLARGLGSSSAAIVAGLALAWELASPGIPMDSDWAFARAYRVEGHGDNVGPAILGGLTITWSNHTGSALPQIRTSSVRGDLRVLALVPSEVLLTDSARSALPKEVPLVDAVANIACAALLVHALAQDPSVLFDATQDTLHQPYRAGLYPGSHGLLAALRKRGYAAVISGAGPTVAVLHTQEQSEELIRVVDGLTEAQGWQVHLLRPGDGARAVTPRT